jgi:TrpR-related protein YerC/YecD
MQDSSIKVWELERPQQLVSVLLSINDPRDMQNFLRDLMTEKEIIETSARLEAAKMLNDGAKYIEIIKKTKLSSRTIARISDWLQNGNQGYMVALRSISGHHTHIPPVRAE